MSSLAGDDVSPSETPNPSDAGPPSVGRGEDGEIVIIDYDGWAASFDDGQWFPGIRFDEILGFIDVRDPVAVKALIDEAREALRGVPEPLPMAREPVTSYAVLVDDNFHCRDVSERHRAGTFADYLAAVACCMTIVDRFLVGEYKQGMKPEELWGHYRAFGEDPFIRPRPPAPIERFSAWTYASARCTEICGS
jgi:hypothetical protein